MFRKLAIFALLVATVFASPQDRERRILGGIDNVLGEVPWAVSLRTLAGVHFCTGSIINNWFVITTADCIHSRVASGVHLVLGRVTLDGTGGMNRQGFRLITHPSFNANTLAWTVGLVQVSVIITFSGTVQSIFLGDTAIGGGVHAKVSGWGSTSQEMGETSNNLRTLDTTTLSNSDCQARHTSGNVERITTAVLCTNNGENEGFCGTGVGGPLVWNSQLIGIASWNIPCGFGWPDVYTRITSVRTWILSQIGSQ